MQIGIIGSGGMGRCLASTFVRAGHRVSIANSRGPDSLQPFARSIGAEAVDTAAAIKNKQLIVVSIPQKNIPDLPAQLFQQLPEDTVVIDTGNYYPTLRDGIIPALEKTGIDSWWVQEQLGFPVVKVFNSILADSIQELGKPAGDKDRIAIAVSGGGAVQKEMVFNLVNEMGFDAVDLGTIAQSWKQQPGSAIYCRDIVSSIVKQRVAAMGDNWNEMRDAVLAKRRADEAIMKADYPAYLKQLKAT